MLTRVSSFYIVDLELSISPQINNLSIFRYRYMGVRASSRKAQEEKAHAEAVKNATKNGIKKEK